MADENLVDFNARVTRLARAHDDGRGFEAPGALGRSHYRRRRGWRIPLMGPVFVLVAGVVLLKAAILVHLGESGYQDRLDRLWQGGALDRAGALFMQPEPLTLWIAGQFGALR